VEYFTNTIIHIDFDGYTIVLRLFCERPRKIAAEENKADAVRFSS
jgi:hypothetical protein